MHFLIVLSMLLLQEDAERLIQRLGNDDPNVRDAASRRLIELGAKAGPALARHLGDRDPEVRERIARIVAQGKILSGVLDVARDAGSPHRAAAAAAFHAMHLRMPADDGTGKNHDLLDSTIERGLTFRQLRDDFLAHGFPLVVLPGVPQDRLDRAAPAGTYREMLEHFCRRMEVGIQYLPGGVAIGPGIGRLDLKHLCSALLLCDDRPSAALLACTLDQVLAERLAARDDAETARILMVYWARGGSAPIEVSDPLPRFFFEALGTGPWRRRAAAAAALAKIPKASAAYVRRAFTADGETTRYLAAWVAARTGEPAMDHPALASLLDSTSPVVREEALRAMLRVTPDASLPADRVLHTAARLRPSRRPVTLLRARGGLPLARAAANALAGEDAERRAVAWQIVDAFTAPEARDAVCSVLMSVNRDEDLARAVDVIRAYGAHPSVKKVAADLFVRARRGRAFKCAELLRTHWAGEADALLARALSNKSAAIRERAIKVIRSIDRLESHARSESESDLKQLALRRASLLRLNPPKVKRQPDPVEVSPAAAEPAPEAPKSAVSWTVDYEVKVTRP